MNRYWLLGALLLTASLARAGAGSVPGAPHPEGVQRAPADYAAMLPVESTRLSPGRVEHRRLGMPGMRTLFLVGDDALSLAWLGQRAATLRALQAVGLAVQVKDVAGLARLRAAAPGLSITPVSGDDLALRLRIQHYPVLITATALEQ
jgi:integrating conjugative element protein (TIGR03765 family)